MKKLSEMNAKELDRTEYILSIIALIAEVAVLISNIVKFDSYSPVIIVVASVAIAGLILNIIDHIKRGKRLKKRKAEFDKKE